MSSSETGKATKQPRLKRLLVLVAVIAMVCGLLYFALYLASREALKEWSGPQLGDLLSNYLHERVEVDDAQWTLAPDALVLKIESPKISDLSGKPVMSAKKLQVGVSFLALLGSRVKVHRIDLVDPVVYAQKWNPSQQSTANVPDFLSEIGHLSIRHGTIVLDDAQQPKPPGFTEITDVNCNLQRPLGNVAWLFGVSFAVKHQGQTSTFSIKGIGHGNVDNLQNCGYLALMKAKNIYPGDLVILQRPDSLLQGPIDGNLKIFGIPSKRLEASGYVTASGMGLKFDRLSFSQQDAATQTTKIELKKAKITTAEGKAVPGVYSGALSIAGQSVTQADVHGQIDRGTVEITGRGSLQDGIDFLCTATRLDIGKVREALNALSSQLPPSLNQPWFGTIKDASVSVSGTAKAPLVAITAQPENVYYEDSEHRTLFAATGGTIRCSPTSVQFDKLTGTVGSGTFQADGTVGMGTNQGIDVHFAAKNFDIGTVESALETLGADGSAFNPDVNGTVTSAAGTVRGNQKNPLVAMSVVPASVFYQPPGTAKTIEVIGGTIDVTGNALRFHKTQGRLGKGTFNLDGSSTLAASPTMALHFEGQDLDLANVKTALVELGVQPLPGQSALAGSLRKVAMSIRGNAQAPVISMTCYPDDILCELAGSASAIHARSGVVSYSNDNLKVAGVDVSTPRSRLNVSLQADHVSTQPVLSDFLADADCFDLSDLHAYLLAPGTPPTVKQQYLQLLNQLQVEPESGKLHGKVRYQWINNNVVLTGRVGFDGIAGRISGLPFAHVSGSVYTPTSDRLNVDNISGSLGKSDFTADGYLSSFNDPSKETWHVGVKSQVDISNLISLSASQYPSGFQVESTAPLNVTAALTGTNQQLEFGFAADADSNSKLVINAPAGGTIEKPVGAPLSLDGAIVFDQGGITVPETEIRLGDALLIAHGALEQGAGQKTPHIDFGLSVPQPLPMRTALGLVVVQGVPLGTSGATGAVSGAVSIKGPIAQPTIRGNVTLSNVTIPALGVANLTGAIDAQSEEDHGEEQLPVKINLSTVTLGAVDLQNLKATLVPSGQADSASVSITDGAAGLYGGTVRVSGTIPFNGTADITANLSGIDADQFAARVLKAPHEISGTASGTAKISLDPKQANSLSALSAHAQLTLTNGRVRRFSMLETGVSALNTLHGGILDFNLNNLLTTFSNGSSGKFTKLKANFDLKNGVLDINHVYFGGTDMKMRAQGSVDLNVQSVVIKAFGKVPSVSSRGLLGPIAQFLSIRGLATMAEDLPEYLTDTYKPPKNVSVFKFAVNGRLNDPESLVGSVLKSFTWLHGKGSQ